MNDDTQENYDTELQKKAQEHGEKLEWHIMGQRRMYPAILGMDHAIYFEAAPLLYTETTIDMETCDVLCFSESPNVHVHET